jgi:hypothetical protein
MPLMTKKRFNRDWGFRNGPGVLILITAGMLVVVILVWRSGASWRVAAALVFAAILSVLLAFSKYIRCRFDLDRQLIHLRQSSLWKRTSREIPFDEVNSVGVAASSIGTSRRTFRVVLALESGELIPLTAHPSTGKLTKESLARRIADALNEFLPDPVTLALNGVISVIRKGYTRDTTWQLETLTANDRTPSTQWFSPSAPFSEGFILLIPGRHSASSTRRELNRSVLFFYRQYLRTLGIDADQIAGFQQAQLLGEWDHPLGRYFSCLTNDPAAAERWLFSLGMDKLMPWLEGKQLSGSQAEGEPHLLASTEGLRLIFRRLYYQEEDVQLIADLGASLVEKRSTGW